MALLEVRDLRTYFHTREGVVRAVDGVSFDVEAGQTVGIVGESGSGKSVTCYSLLKLIPQPPGKIECGTARFGELELLSLSDAKMRQVRGKRIGLIFQDPMTSLNPYLRISTQLIEPLLIHEGLSKSKALERAVAELDAVGIPDPKSRIHSYPHEFSGGMRQRVMIAMALITRPEILIADEPTTALDVTIQRQVLDLIKARQEDLGTAVIFITHDLAVVSEVCDYVNVMYAGRFVERADVKTLLASRATHTLRRFSGQFQLCSRRAKRSTPFRGFLRISQPEFLVVPLALAVSCPRDLLITRGIVLLWWRLSPLTGSRIVRAVWLLTFKEYFLCPISNSNS